MKSPFFPNLDLDLIEVYPDSAVGDLVYEAGGYFAATFGNDVYFYADQYNPYSVSGTGLLAHELAHAQQYADASGYGSFLFDYLLEYLLNGYENNPYELDAQRISAEVEAALNAKGGIPPCDKEKDC